MIATAAASESVPETAAALASGKGSSDENFPVASALIAPRHRPVVMAFYRFVRAADDVADSATAEPAVKLALLEDLRAGLTGESDKSAEGLALRRALAEHALSDQHALDLLEAFRRDVTKLRYADWDDLMDYCRYSASPVGRFVLDVHGEDPALWPMNDALCNALQVINHLQDCGKDRREIDRVYIPLDRPGRRRRRRRGAGRGQGLARPARGDRRSGAADLGPARHLAPLCPQGEGHSPGAGDRRDPDPGRGPVQGPDDPRPAEPDRAPFQAADGRPGLGRHGPHQACHV